MCIVISPHVDDGVIGCFSLIKKGLIDGVVYLDATPERFALAQIAGKQFGFKVVFLHYRYLIDFLQQNSKDTFLVPDISDNHVLHKAVNCIARLSGCKLGYYSVDMAASFVKELSRSDQQEKRAMLNKFYPDQKSLWENDWKYFLFEGVVYDFNTTDTAM